MKKNLLYLSLLVFVLSLQALIIFVEVYQFIPMKMDPITEGVPESLLKFFKPNHNHEFYHFFVAVTIIGQVAMLYWFRKRLKEEDLADKIRPFLVCEVFWVSWQLFAVFKILQYDNPGWARVLLYAGLLAAVAAKIFWPELSRLLKQAQDQMAKPIPKAWYWMVDGGMVLLLLSIIAIPDMDKALGKLAFFDSNNHFDQWLMMPLWAYHKGLIPALQAYNPLNGGMLPLMNVLASLAGGVTYAHVLTALCCLAIVYYTVFYFFLRRWLGVLAAVFGVLVAVKLQMFNAGISPLIWVYPTQSVARHFFDVAVFFCLLVYAQNQKEMYLWLGAAAVGLALSFVFDTGFYMLVAFYAYLAVLMSFEDTRRQLCPVPKQWRKILGLALVPWLAMLAALWFDFGPAVLQNAFWANSFKDLPAWISGAGAISIYSPLKDRNFYAFFAAFFPPLLYASGIVLVVQRVFKRLWSVEKLLIVPLSVYGLGVYAHFLWHGSMNYYYLAPLPLVACVCFWGWQCLPSGKKQRRLIKSVLACGAFIALFSNVFFTYYPNIFNLTGDNGEQEKAVYNGYHFSQDADFVRHLTAPSQRVALISGFTTQILVDADRASYFYGGLPLISMDDVDELSKELQDHPPSELFIDKGVLGYASGPLAGLVDYVKAHYQFSGQESGRLVLLRKSHE